MLSNQGLSRGKGSSRDDIQDLASSTSSQRDSSSWAVGKSSSKHSILGSQRWIEAASLECGLIWRPTQGLGVRIRGNRSRKRVVKWKPLADIMGHFLTEITQTQGIIWGKYHKHRTAAWCQQHSIIPHVRNRVLQPETAVSCSCPNILQEMGRTTSLYNIYRHKTEVLT